MPVIQHLPQIDFYYQLEQEMLALQTQKKISYWEAKKIATNKMISQLIHMHLCWQETTCNQDINNHLIKSSYPLNPNSHLNNNPYNNSIPRNSSNLMYNYLINNNYLTPSTAQSIILKVYRQYTKLNKSIEKHLNEKEVDQLEEMALK